MIWKSTAWALTHLRSCSLFFGSNMALTSQTTSWIRAVTASRDIVLKCWKYVCVFFWFRVFVIDFTRWFCRLRKLAKNLKNDLEVSKETLCENLEYAIGVLESNYLKANRSVNILFTLTKEKQCNKCSIILLNHKPTLTLAVNIYLVERTWNHIILI